MSKPDSRLKTGLAARLLALEKRLQPSAEIRVTVDWTAQNEGLGPNEIEIIIDGQRRIVKI